MRSKVDDDGMDIQRIDSYQHETDKMRPFYVVTDESNEFDTCNGDNVNGLSQLEFTNLGADHRIDFEMISIVNGSDVDVIYGVPLYEFLPTYVSRSDDLTILVVDNVGLNLS